ncbi:MAG: 50S ribosomal protein L25 [Cyanobacteria bacterium P01_H01_bin.15]
MAINVECQKRPDGAKPKALRREGLIPATLYGHKGSESEALVVDKKAVELLLKQMSSIETVLSLKVPELSWEGSAVIKEIQRHPWKQGIYHLSFCSVEALAE